MNKNRRTLLICISIAIFVMIVYPPYNQIRNYKPQIISTGYLLITDLQSIDSSSHYEINLPTLAVQIFGVLIVGGLLYLVLGAKTDPTNIQKPISITTTQSSKKSRISPLFSVVAFTIGGLIVISIRMFILGEHKEKVPIDSNTNSTKSTLVPYQPTEPRDLLALDVIDPYYNVANSKTKSSTQDEYFRTLRQLVPDVDTIAANPKFSSFLSANDSTSGRSYFDLAKEAEANLDAYRVASFYLSFKRLDTILK